MATSTLTADSTNKYKELLDTGIVENGHTVDQLLADCFDRFYQAKQTVNDNMPDYYKASPVRPRSGQAAGPLSKSNR